MKKTNNTEVVANKKDEKKVSIKMIALYAFIGSLIVAMGVNARNAVLNANTNEDVAIEMTEEVEPN